MTIDGQDLQRAGRRPYNHSHVQTGRGPVKRLE